MNKYFTLRRAALLLALTLPSVSWGFVPQSALIVTETGSPFQTDINKVVTFLSGRLTAASFVVTTNNGVPSGSLAGYQQIWDIRADTALSGTDITAYVTYMAAGGSLFAMGENGGCCAVRDASVVALIAAAGGGAVTTESNSNNNQTVQPPFTGPVSLTSISYAAIGGFTSIGSGAFISTDTSTSGGAVIFGPGTMTNASAGVLASVLDINFMDSPGPGVSQALTDNLIAYFAAPVIITPPGATSFTFTGPSSGAINVASGNFTITPNLAYTGTITITPAGGGLSTPIVLTFTGSAAAQTFTITPTAAGPVTLTPTNSGSLTNPAALSYSTPPGAPTIGAATANSGASASVAFIAPLSTGGSPITQYTATCNPGGISATGTASPIAVTGLTPGSTYTCTVKATNSIGTSAASAASNQVTIPATGYTLTGPAGGLINNVSSNFTITPNGALTGTITITLSGGSATASIMKRFGGTPAAKGGHPNAVVRTFSNSSVPQTFTITPTGVGPVTITATNNASLADPPPLNYATQPGPPTIGTATPSAGSIAVAFTPSATGGSPVTSYTATCSPGGASSTGTSSPIYVSGTANTYYTCTVTATNAFGVSAASSASNSVLPLLPATPAPSTLVLFGIGGAALFLWKRRKVA